ncbi:MAG: nucleotidyl transferase AbiEii/AbiGii toxin family protein [Chitinophagaceae bacterium]|nr:nucleotidyl transferase AbiEii/AbiGii toxin family protein [Chitinophagaceae bacterium]
MIKDWLQNYAPKTQSDYTLALREIMQQITLAGLYRGGFFGKAAFYGGTALRIFYGLQRFSEDLDFSLLLKDEHFHLDDYFKPIEEEFRAQGMTVAIKTKKKTRQSNVESAFLKSETAWSELVLENVVPQAGLRQAAGIKIKIEVDTQPPLGFETEEKLLLQPFSFYVKCFTIEDLFAGKIHALLFRKWNNNVKGRDWYDMEWYIRRGTVLNLHHFLMRAKDSGDWTKNTISESEFRALLNNRIDNVNMEMVKADISRFVPDPAALKIWSKPYFHDLVKLMKIK